jgi:hypothetical protein
VVTDLAVARFYAPGQANMGLDAFNVETIVKGTRTRTTDKSGEHTDTSWFDKFTLFTKTTGQAWLSCSAGGTVPADGFDSADDLQLAALDATALHMEPAGDATTRANDALLCPGLSLRVLLVWHASGPAAVESARDGDCPAKLIAAPERDWNNDRITSLEQPQRDLPRPKRKR